MPDTPYISLIIPVYNESKRLFHVDEINNFLKKQKFSSELIIVNDGSTDNTLEELIKLQDNVNFNLISYHQNYGKGYAVKTGMMKAKGQYQLFTDIDLSTPLTELEKFIPLLPRYDVIIGTRKNPQAKIIIRQPLLRETLGKCFTLLSQFVLGVRVSDFTCGFKCFSAKAAKEIFPYQNIKRWGFDSEILFIAQKRRLKIKEIPVVWKNDISTKVRFPQDLIKSLTELFTIRLYNLYGNYNKQS